MGTQYLMDTNAVIEFLAGELPDSGSDWLQNLLDENANFFSKSVLIYLDSDGYPKKLLQI